jgi:class 3 adenylate cyclase
MPTIRSALILVVLLQGAPFRSTAQLPADSLLNALKGRQAPMEKLSTLRELSRAGGIPPDVHFLYAQRTVAFADTALAVPGIDGGKVLSLKASGVFNIAWSRYAKASPQKKDSLVAGYRQAERLWRQSGDQERIAFVTYRIAEVLDGMDQQKEAFDLAMESYRTYAERSDTAGMIKALKLCSMVSKHVGDLSGGLRHDRHALDLARLGAPQEEAGLELSLALAYAFTKEYDSVEHYLTSILERKAPPSDPRIWNMAASNYMILQIDLQQPERAIDFWNSLAPEVRNDTMTSDVATLRYGHAMVLEHLKRYGDAIREAATCIRTLERCGCYEEHRTQARLVLAKAQLGAGRPKLSLKAAQKAWEECEQRAFSLHVEKAAALALEQVHEQLGNAEEALRYSRWVKVYTDSMNVMDLRKELSQMEWRKQQAADSLRVVEEKRLMQQEAEARVGAQRNRKLLAFGGGAAVLVFALVLWRRLGRTRKEHARTEEILHNVLPEEVAREIRETGAAQNREIEQVSILFTDFKGFTELSERLSRQALMAEIGACFKVFDDISHRHGVEKIKTIGDAYMAAAGLKGEVRGGALGAVHAALEMQAFIEARHRERSVQGLPAFLMRVGIHTGPVVAGIVGVKKFQYDIWGDTVNTASRMESSGEVGQVNISEATYALVKNETSLTFTPRGKVQAKGKGEMEMYFVHRSSVQG